MKISKSWDFIIGIILVSLILLLTITGLFFLPFEYNEMQSDNQFSPPGFPFLLGTDNFGRDVFSRIMAGGIHTIMTAVLTVIGSAFLGSILGMMAGFFGSILDEAIMRLMDAISSFPGILLALVFVSVFNHDALVIALIILFTPGFTRIMRSGTVQIRQRDFILAARIIGTSRPRILLVHILPNLFPQLLSASIVALSNAILAESTMSYLGLGIQPPVPSWGRMLAESQGFLFNAPWAAIAPGIMIMLSVLAFHFTGEGLRQLSTPISTIQEDSQ